MLVCAWEHQRAEMSVCTIKTQRACEYERGYACVPIRSGAMRGRQTWWVAASPALDTGSGCSCCIGN
jgi:hypothetical protein